MVIKFYGPFLELIRENVLEFNIDREMTLIEFSMRLVEKFPILRDYIIGEKDFDLLNSIFFISRKSKLLGPEDIVNDKDEIVIMIPLEGG